MKRSSQLLVLLSVATLLLVAALFRLAAVEPASLKIVKGSRAKSGDAITFRLEVQAGSNDVTCVVQTSTNLVNWQTVFSTRTKVDAPPAVAEFNATNDARFFRLVEFLCEHFEILIGESG